MLSHVILWFPHLMALWMDRSNSRQDLVSALHNEGLRQVSLHDHRVEDVEVFDGTPMLLGKSIF